MTTSASEWAKKGQEAAPAAAVELTLPSGAVILARRPDPVQLASWGYLPLGLVQTDGQKASAADLARYAAFMRDVLQYCCVQPRVSLDPQGPEEIAPGQIPDGDWQFIVKWATRQQEVEALRRFHGGRDAGAGDRGGRADVAGEAVADASDRGAGDGAGAGPGGDGPGGARVVAIG